MSAVVGEKETDSERRRKKKSWGVFNLFLFTPALQEAFHEAAVGDFWSGSTWILQTFHHFSSACLLYISVLIFLLFVKIW